MDFSVRKSPGTIYSESSEGKDASLLWVCWWLRAHTWSEMMGRFWVWNFSCSTLSRMSQCQPCCSSSQPLSGLSHDSASASSFKYQIGRVRWKLCEQTGSKWWWKQLKVNPVMGDSVFTEASKVHQSPLGFLSQVNALSGQLHSELCT